MERMENNKIARRVYVGKCAGSPPVDRLEKSWINTVKEYLKKKKVWLSGKQGKWCVIRMNGRGV